MLTLDLLFSGGLFIEIFDTLYYGVCDHTKIRVSCPQSFPCTFAPIVITSIFSLRLVILQVLAVRSLDVSFSQYAGTWMCLSHLT